MGTDDDHRAGLAGGQPTAYVERQRADVTSARAVGPVGDDLDARDVLGPVGEGPAGGQPGAVVIIGANDGKVAAVAAVNDEGRARGVSANALIRAVGPLLGGKGGGKDDVAQGGGTDVSRIDEALVAVETEVARAVEAG